MKELLKQFLILYVAMILAAGLGWLHAWTVLR